MQKKLHKNLDFLASIINMVLKIELDWPVRLLADHGFGLVQSFRLKSVQTGIRLVKSVVRQVNRINRTVRGNYLIQLFFFHYRHPRQQDPPTRNPIGTPLPHAGKAPPTCRLPPTEPPLPYNPPALEKEMRIQSSGRVR